MRKLEIAAERCVHHRAVHADCRACVDVCPRDAWRANPGGLGFEASACDGCGLCAAACPTDALALPVPAPVVGTAAGRRALFIACERVDSQPDATEASPVDTPGVVPCLHAITPGWLLEALRSNGPVDDIAYAHSDCSRCSRARAPDWRGAWQRVAARLEALDHPVPTLRPMDAARWLADSAQSLTRAPSTPAPARRRFLGMLGHSSPAPGKRRSEATLPLRGGRATAVAALQQIGASAHRRPTPLWAVRLATARCTWCLACTHVCESHALRLQPQPDGEHALFELDLARCTGCGLCHAVCEPGALSHPGEPDTPAARSAQAGQAAAAGPERVPLQRERCPICKVHYHRLATPAGGAGGRCPTCARGRPARPDRIVQSAS